MSNMLGSALAEIAGPLKDFFEKLQGKNAEKWIADFKKFLRKEERDAFILLYMMDGGHSQTYVGPLTTDEAIDWLKDNGFTFPASFVDCAERKKESYYYKLREDGTRFVRSVLHEEVKALICKLNDPELGIISDDPDLPSKTDLRR